jgi:predicted esterase
MNKYKRKYFDQNVSKLPEFEPKYELVVVHPRAKHTATLLFMHGIGDSGDGWAQTFEQYSRHFPYLKVICPSAHTRPVTRFDGQEAPAWCDAKASAPQLINGFQSIPSSQEDTKGFQETISNRIFIPQTSECLRDIVEFIKQRVPQV